MSQHKIFTTLNQPLGVDIYNLLDPAGAPIPQTVLEGLPLGSSNNAEDGELGVKVIVVASRGSNPNSSASGVETVTPSDSVALTTPARGLYIGSGGDISVVMEDGSTGVFVAVPTGMILPAQVVQVNSTGTTASSILALL